MPDLADEKKAVLGALEEGETWEAASLRSGYSYRTVHRWMDDDPDFAAAATKARKVGRSLRAGVIERALFAGAAQAAEDPRFTTAAIFALKNLRPDEWRDEQHQHVSGADGGPIQVDAAAVRDMFTAWREEDPS